MGPGPRALWEIPGDSEGTSQLFKCLQNNGCYVTAVSFKELKGEEKKSRQWGTENNMREKNV